MIIMRPFVVGLSYDKLTLFHMTVLLLSFSLISSFRSIPFSQPKLYRHHHHSHDSHHLYHYHDMKSITCKINRLRQSIYSASIDDASYNNQSSSTILLSSITLSTLPLVSIDFNSTTSDALIPSSTITPSTNTATTSITTSSSSFKSHHTLQHLLERYITNLFPVWVLSFSLLGFYQPGHNYYYYESIVY